MFLYQTFMVKIVQSSFYIFILKLEQVQKLLALQNQILHAISIAKSVKRVNSTKNCCANSTLNSSTFFSLDFSDFPIHFSSPFFDGVSVEKLMPEPSWRKSSSKLSKGRKTCGFLHLFLSTSCSCAQNSVSSFVCFFFRKSARVQQTSDFGKFFSICPVFTFSTL